MDFDVVQSDIAAKEAEYVIHAAAMPHYGDGQATEESIRDATYNPLQRADDLECESLVIPALGCGVAGFSLEHGSSPKRSPTTTPRPSRTSVVSPMPTRS